MRQAIYVIVSFFLLFATSGCQTTLRNVSLLDAGDAANFEAVEVAVDKYFRAETPEKMREAVEEAKQGHNIMKAFLKLGVRPEQHTSLVKVCKEINDSGFIQAALKLGKIEAENNMSYQEVMARLENTLSQLAAKEKLLNRKETKLVDTEARLNVKKKELGELENKLAKLHKDIKAADVELTQKIEANMEKLKLKKAEIEEFSRLRAELNKKGLDIETLMKLAKEFGYATTKS